MRYVVFALFAVVPVLLWPTPWTLLGVLALGLPFALALIGDNDKPRETDPAIWDKDPVVLKARLAAAMDQWRARRRGGAA